VGPSHHGGKQAKEYNLALRGRNYMVITKHSSRLILGKPVIRLDCRSFDSYWSCGCRGRTLESGTVDIAWCRDHAEIFEKPDLKLQA
jgi:hypothetical protein